MSKMWSHTANPSLTQISGKYLYNYSMYITAIYAQSLYTRYVSFSNVIYIHKLALLYVLYFAVVTLWDK